MIRVAAGVPLAVGVPYADLGPGVGRGVHHRRQPGADAPVHVVGARRRGRQDFVGHATRFGNFSAAVAEIQDAERDPQVLRRIRNPLVERVRPLERGDHRLGGVALGEHEC